MTTKDEFLAELKDWIESKKEEFETESNEEAMQWQEDAGNEESEYYEISKYEYETILERKGDIDRTIEKIEQYLFDNFYI